MRSPSAPGWSALPWQHPLLAGLADVVAPVAALPAWPSPAELGRVLAAGLGAAGVELRAASKARARRGRGARIDPASIYELVIADAGVVPTRPNNLHDLLNALAWAAFPASKRALTAALAVAQRARIAGAERMPPARSPGHDRLALLDEGGLVVGADVATLARVRAGEAELADALAAAVAAGTAGVVVFGHAVLEHGLTGRPWPRVALVTLVVPPAAGEPVPSWRRCVDAALARALASAEVALRSGPGLVIDPRWLRGPDAGGAAAPA